VYGLTRYEVAAVEITVNGNSRRVDTFAHPAGPQLRFFILAVPGSRPAAPFHAAALDREGGLLTDEGRIRAEQDAFTQAMDARAGVEIKPAAIVDAEITDDGHTIVLTSTPVAPSRTSR